MGDDAAREIWPGVEARGGEAGIGAGFLSTKAKQGVVCLNDNSAMAFDRNERAWSVTRLHSGDHDRLADRPLKLFTKSRVVMFIRMSGPRAADRTPYLLGLQGNCMTDAYDPSYYAMRAETVRNLAKNARDQSIKKIHENMARQYDMLAANAKRKYLNLNSTN